MTLDTFWIGAIIFATGVATLLGAGIAVLFIELLYWSYRCLIVSLAAFAMSFGSRLRRWRSAWH